MTIALRSMTTADFDSVLDIYAQGLAARVATFETETPTKTQWDKKYHHHSRWVAVENNTVIGWAALQPVSARDVYRGVAEVSVYVGFNQHGKGAGKRLLQQLIISSEENGIWTLQSSIFPENTATINLHLACGFRKLGVRERIAQLDGEWRDTWILERRSKRVGI